MAIPSKPSQCLKFSLCSLHTAERFTFPTCSSDFSLLHWRLELKSFSGFPIKSSSKTLAWHLRPVILPQVFFLRPISSTLVAQLCPTLCNPTRLLGPWKSPDKNTGVGCHSLFQGIFLIRGWNRGFLHCRQILYRLSHLGKYTIFRNSVV